DGEIKLELPKEKNHAGGIKNPYTASDTSFILPDTLENIYIPVANI
ncbi:13542_t:CDS:1, partial [Funneliformis caledonium]